MTGLYQVILLTRSALLGSAHNSEIEPLCGLIVMAHRGKCEANPSLRGRLRSWAAYSFIVARNAALAKRELGVGAGRLG
jgi:hypothetical protein